MTKQIIPTRTIDTVDTDNGDGTSTRVQTTVVTTTISNELLKRQAVAQAQRAQDMLDGATEMQGKSLSVKTEEKK